MTIRDLAPWNWGKKDVPVRRESETQDPFMALQSRMNRLFEDVWQGRMAPFGDLGRELDARWPALNVTEDESAYTIEAEMPGMEEKDIDVSIARSVLTIRGERNDEKTEGDGKERRTVERYYGSFHRSIPLGCEIDPEKAEATLKNGLLTLTLPKVNAEQDKTRHITVHHGSDN